MHRWADKWLVTFNPGKSESIILSRKYIKPYHPQVLLNQTQTAEIHSHKHLGIIYSNDWTWHKYLELVKSKTWKRINIMRKLKFQLDRKSFQTTYYSFIRPLLEYADVVWNNCTQCESNKLDKIQNEAARIVSGATKLASIDSLYTETGWNTLGSRRKTHKLTMFYKMKNGLWPDYIVSLEIGALRVKVLSFQKKIKVFRFENATIVRLIMLFVVTSKAKIRKDVAKFVVCCKCDWRCKV